MLFLNFQQVQQSTHPTDQHKTRPQPHESCLYVTITTPVSTECCQALSPPLFLQRFQTTRSLQSLRKGTDERACILFPSWGLRRQTSLTLM